MVLRWRLNRAYPLIVVAALDFTYTIYFLLSAPPSSTPSRQRPIPWRILFVALARISLVSYVGISKEWRKKGGYVGALCGITLGQAVWEGCSGILMRKDGDVVLLSMTIRESQELGVGKDKVGQGGEVVDKQYLIFSSFIAILEYLTYLALLRLSPATSHPSHTTRHRSQSMRLPTSQTHRTPSSVRYYSTSHAGNVNTTPNLPNGYTPSPGSFRRARNGKGHSRHVSRATMRSVRSTRSGGDRTAAHLLSPPRDRDRCRQYHGHGNGYGAIGEHHASGSRILPESKGDEGVSAMTRPRIGTDVSADVDVFTSSAQPAFSPKHGLNRRSVDKKFNAVGSRSASGSGRAEQGLSGGDIACHADDLISLDWGAGGHNDDDQDQPACDDSEGYGYGYEPEFENAAGSGSQARFSPSSSYGHIADRRYHSRYRTDTDVPPDQRGFDLDEFESEDDEYQDEYEGDEIYNDYDGAEMEEEEEATDGDDDIEIDDGGDYDDESDGSSISESSIIDLPPPLSPAPLSVPALALPDVRFPRSTSLNLNLNLNLPMNIGLRERVNSLTSTPGRDLRHVNLGDGMWEDGDAAGSNSASMGVRYPGIRSIGLRKAKSGFALARSWSSVLSPSPRKKGSKKAAAAAAATTTSTSPKREGTSWEPADSTSRIADGQQLNEVAAVDPEGKKGKESAGRTFVFPRDRRRSVPAAEEGGYGTFHR
ncbi:hypothetical protein IAU59_006520 [Kwoniella sp. CBS 9459]